MIPRIPIGSLTPEEFRERYMAPNLPVMLTGAADSWRATAEWVAAAGQPAVGTLAALFPDSEVSVVDGKGKRREMSISEYAAWWESRAVAALEGGEDTDRLIAVLVGILHHGAVDMAVDNTL